VLFLSLFVSCLTPAPADEFAPLDLASIQDRRAVVEERYFRRTAMAEAGGYEDVAKQMRADLAYFSAHFVSVQLNDSGPAVSEERAGFPPCFGFTIRDGRHKAMEGANTAAGGWDAGQGLMTLDLRFKKGDGPEMVLAHELRHVRQSLEIEDKQSVYPPTAQMTDETILADETEAFMWESEVLDASTTGDYMKYVNSLADGVQTGAITSVTTHGFVYIKFPQLEKLWLMWQMGPSDPPRGVVKDAALGLVLLDLNHELLRRNGDDPHAHATQYARSRLGRNDPDVLRIMLPQVDLPLPKELQ
jgi:hypothetical protein